MRGSLSDRTCRNFARAEDGAVAILLAFMIVVIGAAAGGGLDFLRAHNKQSKLQAILDATTISAVATAAKTAGERKEIATKLLNLRLQEAGLTANVEITATKDNVSIVAEALVPTTLLNLINFKSIPIHVQSVAESGLPQNMEIAMVLDYSGSMNRNGKYQSMRDAAIEMITELTSDNAGGNGQEIKIGLVPFSEYVYTEMLTNNIRDVHQSHFGRTVLACLDSRRHAFNITDTSPDSFVNDSRWPAPGMPPEFQEAGNYPNSEVNGTISTNGCNGDGTKTTTTITYTEVCTSGDDDDDDDDVTCQQVPNDPVVETFPADECERNHSPTEILDQNGETVASDFAAVNAQCANYRDRNLQVQPLTTNGSALISRLESMRPVRLTDISLGLEMGWHVISNNQPFTEGAPYSNDSDTTKIIVLLSDGAQTVGGFGPGGSFSIDQANENTGSLCSAIKAKNIRLITVAFDLGDGKAKQLLRNCATSPQRDFYDAQSSSELAAVFREISNALRAPPRLVL